MKIVNGRWFAALTVLASSLPTAARACSEADVAGYIKQMGYWKTVPDPDPMLACFVEHGAMTAGLLIKELHPVNGTAYGTVDQGKHQADEHVLWALRGLYYMTGQDIRAGSASELRKLKLPSDREYWLLFASGDKVNFFAIHPSTDATYIAPQDVQAAIIEAWRSWYAKDGGAFSYKAHPYDDTHSWYEGIIESPGYTPPP